MRVLVVTNMWPTPERPAFGSFVETQVRSLADAGIDTQVEFIDGRAGSAAYLRGIARVRALVRGGGFDLVHAHYGLTAFVAGWQRCPLVVSFCGDDLFGTPDGRGARTARSRLGQLLSQWSAIRADGIICKSEALRRRLWRDRDRRRAHVVPNGVDVGRFRPGDGAGARRDLGWREGRRTVLFVSSEGQIRKRRDLAEAAVRRLSDRGVSVELVVVERTRPEEMPAYYRAADCLVLTSDWEGSPNAVKEALCCDLPVVSVDAGDVASWMAMAPGCRLVERDAGSIADALASVLAERRRVDGSAVREAVDLRTIAARIVAVYREATHVRARPPSPA